MPLHGAAFHEQHLRRLVADAEPVGNGVRHFAIGTDMQILANWWRERGAGLADILGVVPGAVAGDR